jgi:hypothetical protein
VHMTIGLTSYCNHKCRCSPANPDPPLELPDLWRPAVCPGVRD